MKNIITGIYLVIALFTSCQKEQVEPEPIVEEPACNCGILTDIQYNVGSYGGVWKYKARNECSNNNLWVNIDGHIQSGGTANIGDYVCSDKPW